MDDSLIGIIATIATPIVSAIAIVATVWINKCQLDSKDRDRNFDLRYEVIKTFVEKFSGIRSFPATPIQSKISENSDIQELKIKIELLFRESVKRDFEKFLSLHDKFSELQIPMYEKYYSPWMESHPVQEGVSGEDSVLLPEERDSYFRMKYRYEVAYLNLLSDLMSDAHISS